MEHNEYILQKQICQYLNAQHSEILYMSDTIASLRLTKPQAIRNKAIQKSGFKTPDLIIFAPNEKYHGLFIELKTESPFKKDGTIKQSQNDHLKLQLESLKELRDWGYKAEFAWSFDMAKNLIDSYLADY